MANCDYKAWCERLAGQMWQDLQSQIIKACEDIRSGYGDWTRFKSRVTGEFSDKYKIIDITANGDLSDRELTALLTFINPLERVYHKWRDAITADRDGTSKFDLLGGVIDEEAEKRIRYIIEKYDTLEKGDKAVYFDRVMMCTGQREYDPAGDAQEENETSFDEEDLEP